MTGGWTLDMLETSETAIARVWRALFEIGRPARRRELPLSARDAELAHTSLARLVRAGWVKRVGKVAGIDCRSPETLYLAVLDPEPEPRPMRVGIPYAKTQRRISFVIRKAKEARRSALAIEMAKTLLWIESELKDIKGGLGADSLRKPADEMKGGDE